MSGKRKLDDLLEKDLKVVKNLLLSDNTKPPLKLCKLDLFSAAKNRNDPLNMVHIGADLTAVLEATRNLEKSQRKCSETETEFIDADELRKVIDQFVDFYERLDKPKMDETLRKPKYSYTELIFLAVMSSPNFCLPIHEIYHYIATRFPYYLSRSSERWKNAVRHSLSKTRCFTKIGGKKSRQRSGLLNRSCYLWTIVPRSLLNFARGDYRSCVDSQTGTNTLKWAFSQVDASSFWKKCSDSVGKVIQQQRIDLETASTQISNDHQIGHTPRSQFFSDFARLQMGSRAPVCPPVCASHEDTVYFHPDKAQNPASSKMAISSQFSFLKTSQIGTRTSSSESEEMMQSNSPPDSGNETLSQLTSSDDLYRQLILFQSPQLNPTELSFFNDNCQSLWPTFEAPSFEMTNSLSALPPLQSACHPDENENSFSHYNYLPLLESLVPETPIDECLELDTSELSLPNSLFADNSDLTTSSDPTFVDL